MAKQKLISCIAIFCLSFSFVNCVWPEFYFFSRKNPYDGEYADFNSLVPSKALGFDIRKLTFLIIHGYNNNANASWVYATKMELFRKHDANVFAVNWAEGAAGFYPTIAPNVLTCGQRIGQFLLKNKINGLLTHCIGHSLGAHVCGYLAKSTYGKLFRITGLDPAGPGFGTPDPRARLDRSDALLVDIIHTNTLIFGIQINIGHKDFYPNGGSLQPACGPDSICSHQISTWYFVESINVPCNFTAQLCWKEGLNLKCSPTFSRMGYWSSKDSNYGSFYLNTNNNGPFCRG